MSSNKSGRNDPCPCGSGRKYKKCCLGRVERSPTSITAVLFDEQRKQKILVTEDVLINQLQRDGKKIEESFDNLCEKDIKELSSLLSQILAMFYVGLSVASNTNNRIVIVGTNLLFNIVHTFVSAVHVLRSGYTLQPGILLRSMIEALAVILHIIQHPEALSAVQSGEFDSPKAIKSAKEALPLFGKLYGFFSNNFAHISAGHQLLQGPKEYQSRNEPLEDNLFYLRIAVWLMYVTAELLFIETAPQVRYWERVNGGARFNPDSTERKWYESFLRLSSQNQT